MSLLGCLMQQVVRYEESLMRTLFQTRYRDAYGDWVAPRWPKELDYFFKTKVLPQLPDNVTSAELRVLRDHLTGLAEDCDWSKYQPGDEQPPPADGISYEREVGARLSRLGWDVTYTPASGDQGVDLLAALRDRRVAIQCKNYSAPVGNGAVQEVFAGATFYAAQRAIVVAPNGFTPAALQLASSLGVECLHHDQLAAALARPAGVSSDDVRVTEVR